ncbi:hypothetical protein BGX26_006490, partial [Mortierella sp. AD094]
INESIQDTQGVHGVEGHLPEEVKDAVCNGCSKELDQHNSKLVKGRSVGIPVRYDTYCITCRRKFQANARSDNMMLFFESWSHSHWKENFETREIALDTIITVAVQGYTCGPAKYLPFERLHIWGMVRHESPRCFWTGSKLSTKTGSDARVRFSVDRVVFSDGRALSYGSEDQIIVA